MLSIANSNDLAFKTIKFSGGELHPRIDLETWSGEEHYVRADLRNADDILELLLVVDAIRRLGNAPIHLQCPYLPYARQDRVAFPGEALGLKVMCDLINGIKFEEVEVWDVHSDVALALLDRVRHIPQKTFVARIDRSVLSDCVLVAPDLGARKKTLDVAKEFNLPMVSADKIRSTKDGSITGTKVYSDHIGDKDFLIVDDICDGGRTFIELANTRLILGQILTAYLP